MIFFEEIVSEKFNMAEQPYFFVEHDKKRFAVPDKCPHRGGPLSLGTFCQNTNSIKCPWHESQIKISTLIKNSISAVRVKDKLYIPKCT